ncbi:uncharacterized protein LOC133860095 [Alnus glutinosa]|uniref:uncharacterized protein LOC133860095 n=1 Tax=Alnus glutinosa TaxID=3517 RepID=UPI002D781C08|nr:uncharacterized protein LOC133860095 [Alnus glutinosa]
MGNTDSSQTDEAPPMVGDWYFRIFGEVLPDQHPPAARDLYNQLLVEDLGELNNMLQGGAHQSYPTFNHIEQSFHPRLAGIEDLVRSLHSMNLGTAAGNRNFSHGTTSSAVENQGSINLDQMSYEVGSPVETAVFCKVV